MIRNTKLLAVLQKLSTRPKNEPAYTPKFQAGDIILCRFTDKENKDNVFISKIYDIMRDQSDLACNFAQYKMKTLYNNGKTVKSFYTRTGRIQTIDRTYNIINADTARILYSINVEDGE